MCSRVFRGVFRCLGTLSECARGRQCEQVRTCACVRVEWVCVRTRAMLLFFFFFTTHHPPEPCPGLHPGLSFSPNPTNWRGPILQMKKMPPGPWPPAQLAESELPRPQSPLSCCHVGRAQGCLLWDSSSRSGGGRPVFPLEAVARSAPHTGPWGWLGFSGSPRPRAFCLASSPTSALRLCVAPPWG